MQRDRPAHVTKLYPIAADITQLYWIVGSNEFFKIIALCSYHYLLSTAFQLFHLEEFRTGCFSKFKSNPSNSKHSNSPATPLDPDDTKLNLLSDSLAVTIAIILQLSPRK
jgi:hypothetical protein